MLSLSKNSRFVTGLFSVVVGAGVVLSLSSCQQMDGQAPSAEGSCYFGSIDNKEVYMDRYEECISSSSTMPITCCSINKGSWIVTKSSSGDAAASADKAEGRQADKGCR